MIITTPGDAQAFVGLLGDGSQWGINIRYAQQPRPEGLAQAYHIGADFVGNDPSVLILGDNIFHGPGLGRRLEEFTNPKGATIFAYHVSDPTQYGVVHLDRNGQVQSIEEKPAVPKSNWAIPGLYFFDNSCVQRAKNAVRSERNELEITSVLNSYLQDKALEVSILPRGTAWLDTGTVGSLNDAATYFRLLEDRQGTKVSCLEEVAWRLNLISSEKLQSLTESFKGSPYGHYLESLLRETHTREW
jgi:glucose-1-phosphate thymidylyltransferase